MYAGCAMITRIVHELLEKQPADPATTEFRRDREEKQLGFVADRPLQ